MKKIFSLLTILALVGCSETNHSDLDLWMKQQEVSLKGKIEELPEASTHVAVNYVAGQNPFVLKEVASLMNLAKTKYAPDFSRRKEALEAIPLEALKMVGFLNKDGKGFALIKTKDGLVHYISKGNYIGVNYGLVKSVSESEIVLEERIQDDDTWKVKETKLTLDENDSKR